jgi:hypothetical protein
MYVIEKYDRYSIIRLNTDCARAGYPEAFPGRVLKSAPSPK